MIIAVCGFMGAGKSTFLNMYPEVNSVDLDIFMSNELEEDLGDYIRNVGWDQFRDFESESLVKAIDSMGAEGIISLGGGTLDRESNRELLSKRGVKLLHLTLDFEESMKRIKGDLNRPQLDKTHDELFELYSSRDLLFKKVRDFSLPSQPDIWPTNWAVLKTFF